MLIFLLKILQGIEEGGGKGKINKAQGC